MARRRSSPWAPERDVRALLAESLQKLYDHYAGTFEDEPGRPVFGAPWLDKIAALKAGEPVEVPAWEICKWLDPPKPHPNARLRLEADGTVTPLDG